MHRTAARIPRSPAVALALATTLGFAGLAAPPDRGCVCRKAEPLDEYVQADAVFSAIPAASVLLQGEPGSESEEQFTAMIAAGFTAREWTLEVQDVWKGSVGDTVRFSELWFGGDSMFEIGVPVLIFAGEFLEDDGTLSYALGRCGEPVALAEAQEFLEAFPRPLGDDTESDGSLLNAATADLVRLLRAEPEQARRTRLWSALDGRGDLRADDLARLGRVELAAGPSLALDLAVRAALARPDEHPTLLPFLRDAARQESTLRTTIFERFREKENDDPATMAVLRDAILETRRPAPLRVWLALEPGADRTATDLARRLLRLDPDAADDEPGTFDPRELAATIIVQLGLKGDDMAPPLIEGLAPDGEHRLLDAARALGTLGEVGVPPLLELLRSGDEAERARAADGLGAAGRDAEPAIGSLQTAAAGDPDEDVRYAAMVALERIRPGLGWGGYEIWKVGDEEQRDRALEFLADVGGTKAMRELVGWLDDPRREIDAVFSLGWAGVEAELALPALRERARSATGILQTAAQTSIERIERSVAAEN